VTNFLYLMISLQTIFEINSTAKNSSFNIMKKKRNFHGKVVERKQKNVEEYQSNIAMETGEVTSQDAADEAEIEVC